MIVDDLFELDPLDLFDLDELDGMGSTTQFDVNDLCEIGKFYQQVL